MSPSKQHHRIIAVASIVACLLLVFSAFGGWFSPSSWGPLPGLALLTLPIWLVVVLCWIIFLWLKKQRRWFALCVLALMVAWPTIRASFPLRLSRHEVAPTDHTFTLLTFNAHSFNAIDSTARHNVDMQVILDADADIVAIQEAWFYGWYYYDMPSVKPMLSQIERQYPYRYTGYKDAIILFSKFPFEVVPGLPPTPDVIRNNKLRQFQQAYNISLPNGQKCLLLNIYLDSYHLNKAERGITSGNHGFSGRNLLDKLSAQLIKREETAHRMRTFIDSSGAANVIVCGDFNDVPQSYCLRTIQDDDLHDAMAQARSVYNYTYHANHLYVNLDHVLYRGAFEACDYQIIKAGLSDHYPVKVTFKYQ